MIITTYQYLDWTTSSGVDLIVHHMFQSLVVSGSQEDLSVQFPSRVSAVHHLVTSGLVTVVIQQFGNLLDIDSVIEGSGISNLSLVGSNFALETLNQVTDGHTGGDGVGVDDDVGGDALAGEQHVLLSVLDTTRTLLSVSTGELVTDLRNSDGANSDLGELGPVNIERQHDLVHDTSLGVPQEGAGVSLGVSLCLALQLIVIFWQSDGLTNDDIFSGHPETRGNYSVIIQLVIDGCSHSLTCFSGWLLKYLFLIISLCL